MDFVNNNLLPLLQSNVVEPLRPILTPIVHHLPAPVHEFLINLVGAKCYATLVQSLSIAHAECTSLLISKVLGTVIILASTVVKVPQILKILTSQSSAGLSFVSVLLETVSFLITLAYNVRSGWPFSTYGETALILAQDVVIGALILQFSRPTANSRPNTRSTSSTTASSASAAAPAAFVAGLAALSYALFSPSTVPSAWLPQLQTASTALSISSKIPQIATNWANGSTGQLSAFAVFNYLFGSLSRIFTTLAEVDDKLILAGFVAGFALNAVLALQMLVYWNAAGTSALDKKGNNREKAIVAAAAAAGGKGDDVDRKVASAEHGRELGETVEVLAEAAGKKGNTTPRRRG